VPPYGGEGQTVPKHLMRRPHIFPAYASLADNERIPIILL
jgi:hypothetical protein